MKLFKQLLVAPAALGLLAPITANASDLNLNGVSNYSNTSEQVTSISSFSDVQPSDWAYQSLSSLVKSTGCKNGNFDGTRSISRYEAAAVLNACLENVSEVNDSGRRLLEEFSPELATIRGRVESLEAKVGDFGGAQFSTTTKVGGESNFFIGSRVYDKDCATCNEAVHMQYTTLINAITSFNGDDALKFEVEAGNASTASDIVTDTGVSTADNALRVKNLYYTRPFGELLVAVGPLFEMDALVSTTTSSYSNEGLFHGWWYGPNQYARHPKDGAPGAAISYISENGFNAGISYIAFGGADSTLGVGTKEGYDLTTFSAGYDGSNWGGGLIYTLYENPEDILGYAALGASNYGDPSIFGVGAYWNITDKFDISVGVDFVDPDYSNYETLESWSVGADYDFGPGTLSAGVANVIDYSTSGDQEDAGTAYEVYYTYPVSDYITLKPMVMVHSLGESGGTKWIDDTTFALETTFKF